MLYKKFIINVRKGGYDNDFIQHNMKEKHRLMKIKGFNMLSINHLIPTWLI